MVGSEPPPSLPDPGALRPLLTDYFNDPGAHVSRLSDALTDLFCTYADAGVPVERTLALVNVEIEAMTPRTVGSHVAGQTLRRLVMTSCLDCYYPHHPSRDSKRLPA